LKINIPFHYKYPNGTFHPDNDARKIEEKIEILSNHELHEFDFTKIWKTNLH